VTKIINDIKSHYVSPCHHGMASPSVPDGGDGLQIWRVAANKLNNSYGEPIMGVPPAWGWVRG
jgi:hypothetical protein